MKEDSEENNKGKYDNNLLGTYKINVAGHEGYLYLKQKNNRLYGGVKFPNWANGVYEPLKNIKIEKNRIYFTRSATSIKEVRRIGASSYFTQTYSGTYYAKGREIKGFYKHSGAKHSWKAEKIK